MNGADVERLRGHLLFVAADEDAVALDCLLETVDGDTVLVTVTFSAPDDTLPAVLEALRGWVERSALLEVLICDGQRGCRVELMGREGRLVLSRPG